MVAYSFKKRFAPMIMAGLEPGPWVPGMKRQTVRGGRKRHARPGEIIQLYTGMRTRHCRKLGNARCIQVRPIAVHVSDAAVEVVIEGKALSFSELELFVGLDGFSSMFDFVTFWNEQRPHEHPIESLVDGHLILWEPDR